MSITLFAASNSQHSINKALIEIIASTYPSLDYNIIDLDNYPLPIFAIDHLQENGVPENAAQFKSILSASDGLIIAIPEHNGSIPAFFKNILDWVSKADQQYKVLLNKPVVLLSASPGGGGASSVAHAEAILKRLGAMIIDKIVVNNFYQRILRLEDKVIIRDQNLLSGIGGSIENLISYIKQQ